MEGGNVFSHVTVNPFSQLGWTNHWLFVHKETVINTWITIVALLIISLFARSRLGRKNSYVRFLSLSFIEAFKSLCIQSLGKFDYRHFSFITTIFVFIFTCNTISVIPWFKEPTSDLNTTLALGIISFLYTQIYSIKVHGILGYIKEYFKPFSLMFPLHVMEKLSNTVSISFRLFGNIFGGSIIVKLYTKAISSTTLLEILGVLSGVNITVSLFFSLFEGFVQAFVFSMLALTYLSLAIVSHE